MELILQRGITDTHGINGELFCPPAADFNMTGHIGYTLERVGVQITPGRKQVLLRFSPHFNRVMPWIQEPNRTDILMHWGTFLKDTDGCVLVGETQDIKDDEIFGTREEFEKIFPMIQLAVQKEGCWVTVNDPPPTTLESDFEQVEDAALGEN